jgi:hypothetical protein
MTSVLVSVLATLRGLLRSRAALHVEVLALRHQVQVLQRSRPRRLRLVKASASCGRGLRRALRAYVEYHSKSRTHVSLDKDAPFSRRVESRDHGDIVAIPHLGGLHHCHERRAA